MRRSAMAALAAFVALTAAARAHCIDVSTAKTPEFSGPPAFRSFPGAPGFTDVRQGDAPEPTCILDSDAAISITGDPDFADPQRQFRDTRLLSRDSTAAAMRALIGQKAVLRVSEPMSAMIGRGNAPQVARVDSIAEACDATAGYGTAASAVRGLHLALAAGSCDPAAPFILPELSDGNFAPAAVSAFYRAPSKPPPRVSLDAKGPNTFLVRYALRGGAGRCDGSAPITAIPALDRCRGRGRGALPA